MKDENKIDGEKVRVHMYDNYTCVCNYTRHNLSGFASLFAM